MATQNVACVLPCRSIKPRYRRIRPRMDRGNGSCCGCGLRGDSYSRGGVEKAEGAFYMVRVGRICGSAFYERPLATLENCG